MSGLHKHHVSFLVLVVLWHLSCPGQVVSAWTGVDGRGGQSKDHLDPNTRDWGDYSDLQGLGHGLGLDQDREEEEEDGGRGESSSSLSPELDFAGKRRLWVITAPSRHDNYLRMMEKQLEDMEQEGLNCRLAERDTYIITIIQNAMMEGRIQKTTPQGEATMEALSPDTVTKLLHHLDLTNQDPQFSMLVLKKNQRVSEQFPYPVRVDAILELIDQLPARKLEKMTRKLSSPRCRVKKRVLVKKRKTTKRKTVPGALRRGDTAVAPQRKPLADKKAALKSKIQEILRGRSRFVIRKTPPPGGKADDGGDGGGGGAGGGSDGGSGGGGGGSAVITNARGKQKVAPSTTDGAAGPKEESVSSSYAPARGSTAGGKPREKKPEEKPADRKKASGGKTRNGSKKKGKGRRGKGKGRKADSRPSEKDRAAFRDLLEGLRGRRRLMVISTPSKDAVLYVQLQTENHKHHCEFARRKITVATMLGKGRDTTLTLQHFQLDSETPFRGLAGELPDPGVASLLRAELGLSSADLFSMTATDYDLKRNRVFEAPPSVAGLLQHVDAFPSRRPEREREKTKGPSACPAGHSPAAEDVLPRFASKRRLLLVSTPSEDDYSFQQQLSAFTGQGCPMGIRHFALLKMIGTGAHAKGTVELFPLNGRSRSQVEPLSRDAVNNLREQLKVSKDYFSMLVVGKDGDVKAWFPSPMWSLENIYDLVDSLDLRVQEEKLQTSLGIACPEDGGGGGGGGVDDDGGYRGYKEPADERYLYHRGED